MATWPAAIEIADARLVPGQPVTQDLMTDYRDRDDLVLGGLTLLNLSGTFFDVITSATNWVFAVGSNGARADGYVLADKIRIYIPVGLTKLKVNIYAGCSINNAQHGIRVNVGANSVAFTGLPALASAAWRTAAEITLTNTGWQDVQLTVVETGGSHESYVCYGLIIKVSE